MHVGRGDEGPSRVEGRHCGRHGKGAEKPFVEGGTHRRLSAEQVADEPGDDVGGARRIVEPGPGRSRKWSIGGEVRHIGRTFAEQHRDHIARCVDDILLGEVEAVAHRQKMTKRDLVSAVGGVTPLGHGNRLVELETPLVEEGPDDDGEHGLGHRPAQQRCGRGHRGASSDERGQLAGIALGDDGPPMDHNGGVRRLEWTIGVEGKGHDLVQIDAVGWVAALPDIPRPASWRLGGIPAEHWLWEGCAHGSRGAESSTALSSRTRRRSSSASLASSGT